MKLSKSELIVLIKTLKGQRSIEMANSLYVTVQTVKFHLTNIYKKLNIKNGRFELITRYSNILEILDDESMNFELPSGNINKSEMSFNGNKEKMLNNNIEILDSYIKSLVKLDANKETIEMICNCMNTQKELLKALEGD